MLRLSSLFKLMDKVLSKFEEWTLFLTVITALLALFASVILRYGFNYSLAWSEELVRNVIIYTTFIGCSVAVRKRALIKIDAAVQIFPGLHKPLNFLSNLAVLLFSCMMIYYGIKMCQLMLTTQQNTIIMQIPLFWLYLILPVSGGLMLFRTIQVIASSFTENLQE